MLAGLAGLIASGVSFCDVWSRLTSTGGETLIRPPAAAELAAVAQTASVTSIARMVRLTENPPSKTADAGTLPIGARMGYSTSSASTWSASGCGEPTIRVVTGVSRQAA